MKVYRPTFKSKKTDATEKCSHWYITFVDNMQVRRRLPAFANKQATDRAAVNIKDLLDLGGAPTPKLQAWLEKEIPETMRQRLVEWNIVSSRRISSHMGKALAEHVADFRAALEAKGNDVRYARQVGAMLGNLFGELGFKTWTDLDANRLYTHLAGKRGDGGTGQRTFNSHLKAAQHFCKWMVQEQRASSSPLQHLRGVQQTEKRRERRALDLDEQRRLLEATRQGQKHHNLTGHERALVYLLALETGLRAKEIRHLTVAAFDFDACTVTLKSAYTKNKKTAVQNLTPQTVEEVKAFLASKVQTAPAFAMPCDCGRMIKVDLRRARASWIKETSDRAERRERRQSSFLAYRDSTGLVADFHALRHTFITNLARAKVHPSDAMTMARHSTIALTMNFYTHTVREDAKRIVNSLPDLHAAPVRLSSACLGKRSA